MDNFQIRTDLALEARESVNEEESKLRGVSVEEHYEEEADLRITKVTIDTKNAEKMLGKPMGVYVTMEAPAMVEPDDDYHREISEALAEELLKMMPQEQEEQSVLVVGLGNREVTADALGPQVIDNLLITRHVVKNYGKAAYNCTRMNLVSSIEPGVMAKTGMTVADMDLVEANEAFAAQSIAVGEVLGFDKDKLNVNGGAIALGHPIGASGARILVTLLYAMKHRGAHKGLATLCIGGGMGCATIVEMD